MDSNLRLGKYKHYKGNEYEVIGVAKHSETLEDLVFMEALYENPKSKLWARPLKNFTEEVVAPDGIKKQRFSFVSEK